ncbi:hypothetical protein [Oceanicaulis sp. MMSF_3324]|uniref:hypothetical protein n=1 Tax=Oceanicaulis sp. MMSF_3324 TaxID=3046702 RepID=UPI00273E33F0|nr:hypothetical protein [Oceanicaulis sp. MMSF_3324]
MTFRVFGAAVAAGVVLSAASMAMWPDVERMYEYTYYSDASKTTQVGFAFDQCINGHVVLGQAHGTATQYYTRSVIGQCPGYLY